jgi:hypothetical protein
MIQQPDGLIITISQQMLKEKGYRNWLRNFLQAMNEEDCTYFMKLGTVPKKEVLYVYLCIGGIIRFRANWVMYDKEVSIQFRNHDKPMHARAWVVMAGPIVRGRVPMDGFRGFRYTEKLF